MKRLIQVMLAMILVVITALNFNVNPASAQVKPLVDSQNQVSKTALIVAKEANKYLLEGKDIQITYSVDSATNVPYLNYKTAEKDLNFSGEQIQSLKTTDTTGRGIGTLLTVIIEEPLNSDRGGIEVRLSLLVPSVLLLKEDGANAAVQTEAILTTQKRLGNIRGSVLGQIETYEFVTLKGTAS